MFFSFYAYRQFRLFSKIDHIEGYYYSGMSGFENLSGVCFDSFERGGGGRIEIAVFLMLVVFPCFMQGLHKMAHARFCAGCQDCFTRG